MIHKRLENPGPGPRFSITFHSRPSMRRSQNERRQEVSDDIQPPLSMAQQASSRNPGRIRQELSQEEFPSRTDGGSDYERWSRLASDGEDCQMKGPYLMLWQWLERKYPEVLEDYRNDRTRFQKKIRQLNDKRDSRPKEEIVA